MAVPHISPLSTNKWTMILYEIPSEMLMDNGFQLVSKSFETLRTFPRTNCLTITVYEQEMNGHGKWFDRMIVARPKYLVAVHQQD